MSPAFDELLLLPLAQFCDFQVAEWDPATHDETIAADLASGIRRFVYCQIPPPSDRPWPSDVAITWLAMWDQAVGYSSEWWSQLPRALRVVALSDGVQWRAADAGLEHISLRYFPDVKERITKVETNERCLFYWNRRGLLSPKLLSRLCCELQVSELIFRRTLDPGADLSLDYVPTGPAFPAKLTVIDDFLPRAEYLEHVNGSQIFVAPRALEGVGLSSLEAMARGAVVIALDAPTMNEYIDHEHTGMLIRAAGRRDRAANAARTLAGRRRTNYLASDYQDLSWARSMDLEAVGAAAAEQTRLGAESWRSSWASYAEFILAD